MASPPSTRPYLMRAIHQWAVESGLTPYILVDAAAKGVKLPAGYARGGQITLNIHPQAVKDLEMGNEWLLFSARFGGRSFAVELPIYAVLAIYARETGKGIFFQGEGEEESMGADPGAQPEDDPPTPSNKPPPKNGPRLKVIK